MVYSPFGSIGQFAETQYILTAIARRRTILYFTSILTAGTIAMNNLLYFKTISFALNKLEWALPVSAESCSNLYSTDMIADKSCFCMMSEVKC